MDERTQFIKEQKETEELANNALDEAVYYIQKKLGIESGDFASHFFSDGLVLKELIRYIEEENLLRSAYAETKY
jgi:hypothetical protein